MAQRHTLRQAQGEAQRHNHKQCSSCKGGSPDYKDMEQSRPQVIVLQLLRSLGRQPFQQAL